MEKRNIKIPLIIMKKSGSKEGKRLYHNIIKTLLEKDIPYIIYTEKSFILCYNNSTYNINKISEVVKIIDACIVIESDYSKDVVEVVDSLLSIGKDILCFPSNIYNINGYFSNNLIRDGAFCLTSEYMLIEYLSS